MRNPAKPSVLSNTAPLPPVRAKAPRPPSPASGQPEGDPPLPLPPVKAKAPRPPSPASRQPEGDPPLPPVKAKAPRPPSPTSRQPEGDPIIITFADGSSIRRIAIALDFSEDSAYAIRWAVAHHLRREDIVLLLHVHPAVCASTSSSANPNPSDHQSSVEEDPEAASNVIYDDLREVLTASKVEDLANPIRETGIRYKIQIVSDDDVKERLCLEVEKAGVTTLIMGCKGLGAASRKRSTTLGSTTYYCLQHCTFPVIVVRLPNEVNTSGPATSERLHLADAQPVEDAYYSIEETRCPDHVEDTNYSLAALMPKDFKSQMARKPRSKVLGCSSSNSTKLAGAAPDEEGQGLRRSQRVTLMSAIKDADLSWSVQRRSNVTKMDNTTLGDKDKADVCIIYDKRMKRHVPPKNSREKEIPDRISSIMNLLQKNNLLTRCKVYGSDPVQLEHALAVHEEGYLEVIQALPLKDNKLKRKQKCVMAADIFYSDGTKEAVFLAAGAVVKGCYHVAVGVHKSAFAVIRPPGHHAKSSMATGFCFLNNVAIGAKYLEKVHGVKKILIVDFDIHHGDGTQQIFFEDDTVLFFSVHRGGAFYPFGHEKNEEFIGHGRGKGYNINVCWKHDEVIDDDYLAVWHNVLLPVAKQFEPEIIIVSAGFDAAVGDPFGKCFVTPKCFATLINLLKKVGNGKLILALEGGYNLSSLSESAAACVRTLLGDDIGLLETFDYSPYESTWESIQKSRNILGEYWETLNAEIPSHLLDRKRKDPSPDKKKCAPG